LVNGSPRPTGTGTELDWALLRAFLEVVQCGSLSRAAESLGTSQPTLSRQIALLEAQVGATLFERTPRGVRVTEAGAALREPAERMREHARAFALAAAGRSQSLAGSVRLTASEVMSAFVLPPMLAELRMAHPEIQLDLVASNTLENLLEREADIALRMVRPQQTALVARKLPDQPLGLYAHREYVKLHGPPGLADMGDHHWVGFDRSDQLLRGFRSAGFKVSRDFFAFRCDDQVVAWQAVRAGLGIGVGLRRVAALDRDLVRVLPGIKIPPLPLWITAHRELRQAPRLRVVFDALVAKFARR
jgi:DNA-binding transcriptional LysR family regulator